MKDWVNVDFTSQPDILQHDLTEPLPFPNEHFDVVYSSHVLEHFAQQQAKKFAIEMHRILKPGGVLRIVVPDLECIVRNYLLSLERALKGEAGASADYDWMVVELLDQLTRHESGGTMRDYLETKLCNPEFVYKRIGFKRSDLAHSISNQRSKLNLREIFSKIPRVPKFFKNRVFIPALLGSKDHAALQLGRFRTEGEVHQWMYDRYSLARLLSSAGFSNCRKVEATESQIVNWKEFYLDTDENSVIRKPDSLFMEGTA